MVHSLDHCNCVLTASGSSISEFGNQCCCNHTCCPEQCNFISDRNYAILRKVCKKIFKDFNRALCREKYTIFEGGNSINIRIHRADSRGDGVDHVDHYRTESKRNYAVSNDSSIKVQQTNGQSDYKNNTRRYEDPNRDTANRRNNKKKGQDDGSESDNVLTNRKGGRKKQRGDGSESDDVLTNRKGGKKKGRGEGSESDDAVANGKGKRKGRRVDRKEYNDYDDEYTSNRKERQLLNQRVEKQKQKINVRGNEQTEANRGRRNKTGYRNDIETEDSYDSKAVGKKGYSKKRDSEKAENKKSRQRNGDTNYNGHGKASYEVKNMKNKRDKNRDRTHDEDSEIDYNRRNSKKGSKSRDTRDIIDGPEGIEKHGKKLHGTSNGYYDVGDGGNVGNIRNRRNLKISSTRIPTKENYRVINDLRNKVRRGEIIFDVGSSLNSMRTAKTLSHQYGKTKFSRADEVKACDYLRAQMEQRELCKSCCLLQSCQCIPYVCQRKLSDPCYCPNTLSSSFSENCKC